MEIIAFEKGKRCGSSGLNCQAISDGSGQVLPVRSPEGERGGGKGNMGFPLLYSVTVSLLYVRNTHFFSL